VAGFQVLLEPLLALADVGGAGIVGTVGEPQREVPAFQPAGDFDALASVLQSGLADGGIGIAERSVFVVLILKQIGIDRARLYPYSAASFLISSVLATPRGKSHSTCRATLGQTPVSRCTWPASLSFSWAVDAAAGWRNLPNRVPVLAKPQEGSSIRNFSSA